MHILSSPSFFYCSKNSFAFNRILVLIWQQCTIMHECFHAVSTAFCPFQWLNNHTIIWAISTVYQQSTSSSRNFKRILFEFCLLSSNKIIYRDCPREKRKHRSTRCDYYWMSIVCYPCYVVIAIATTERRWLFIFELPYYRSMQKCCNCCDATE